MPDSAEESQNRHLSKIRPHGLILALLGRTRTDVRIFDEDGRRRSPADLCRWQQTKLQRCQILANGKDALFNMPMVAFNVSEDDLNTMCDGKVDYSKVEDKVLKICPRDGVVTLKLTLGYTFGKADLLPVHGGQRPRRRHA